MLASENSEFDRYFPTKIKDEYIDEFNGPSYYDSTIEEEEYLETLPMTKQAARYNQNIANYQHHAYTIRTENRANEKYQAQENQDPIIYQETHYDNENDEIKTDSPKLKNKDPYKNFKIIHETSVNNSNVFQSPQANFKNDNSNLGIQIDETVGKEFSNLPINSALKESTIQIAKINKLLEDHRKKKNQKLIEESMSSPVLGVNFFQEVKDRIGQRRYNGVSKQINLDDPNEVYFVGKNEENNYFKQDMYNVIESAETFGIKYPNNSQFTEDPKISMEMNTEKSVERYLNPMSARDMKFSSENKNSNITSSSKNTGTKCDIPRALIEKSEVKEMLMKKLDKADTGVKKDQKKKIPLSNSNPKSTNSNKLNIQNSQKENINIMNIPGGKKFLINEKFIKKSEKKPTFFNKINDTSNKIEKSVESKNKTSILNYKKDESSKESSIVIPNLFEMEKPKSKGNDRKVTPDIKRTKQEESIRMISNSNSLQGTLKVNSKIENSGYTIERPVENRYSNESGNIKPKNLRLEESFPDSDFVGIQQKTPTNDIQPKFESSSKQIFLKMNEHMMSTKSNGIEDSSDSTYTEVLTKWFGKQPKHEPLKAQVAKLTKLNNKSQSTITDINLESPFANNSTLTKEKRSFVESQKLDFTTATPESAMKSNLSKDEKILASQKRIQNFASMSEVAKPSGYLSRDTSLKEKAQEKKNSSKSPNRYVPQTSINKEVHHQKSQSLKDIKLTHTSLMNSLKLRQEKGLEKKDSVRDLHSNSSKSSFVSKPKIDLSIEEKPKWSDFNIYDRNNMWASAKNSKIENLMSERQKKELEGCTFRPSTISTRCFYSTLRNEQIPTVRKQSEYDLADKQASPERDSDNLLSERNTSRRRSISREKKDIHSYKELYRFKKDWNDISTEIQGNTKRNSSHYHTEGNNEKIPKNFFSAPSRKALDNMNETIKVQQMISQWKNNF